MSLHDLYQRMPYPGRVAMATARGAVLRARREGRWNDEAVAEILERDTWSDERWSAWTTERSTRLVTDAKRHVAAYAGLPDPDADEPLRGIPLLHKEQVRAAPRSFVRDDRRRLVAEHTSGTTATPLTLWISRKDYRGWYAMSEARWRRWYGVRRGDRWAIVGGQQVVPTGATSPPYWVWNAAMRQLYLSSYHISSATAAAYVRALSDHRVRYVVGYPSSIHALAEACRAGGIRPAPLSVVIANAEPVLPHQRRSIEEAFGCPVRETYGMAEYVAAASECEQGRLHWWPDAGIVELLDPGSDQPAAVGTPGRLACTGLVNTSMPLIRYLVGDAATPDDRGPCPCGRTLPTVGSIDGRIDDLVRTRDGRVIGRLDPVFKEDLPIRGAQIVQETLDRFRVLVVPDPVAYGPAAATDIAARLRDRVGDVRVDVELVDELPLGPNGKFKAVVSHVG